MVEATTESKTRIFCLSGFYRGEKKENNSVKLESDLSEMKKEMQAPKLFSHWVAKNIATL